MQLPVISNLEMLMVVLVMTLFAIPSAMLLKRTGHNPYWALLAYMPALALIGLWVLALRGARASA